MKDSNRSDDWRVLCELASKEKDPEKLIDLIVKINQALEECQQKPRSHVYANAYSSLEECQQKPRSHVYANAYSYSVAPQLSQAAEYDC